MMNAFKNGAASLLALLFCAAPAWAAPDVVVTIRPLHSLTAQVMEGVGEPHLLLKTAASPHSYAMRPSDALALNRADLVIWTGESMETFLRRIIPGLSRETVVLTAAEAPGLTLLSVRRADDEADEDDRDEESGLPDAHIWLDPDNATILLTAIAEALAKVDPEHAATYRVNAAEAAKGMDALKAAIAIELAPVAGQSYIAAHDAYHYFERAFSLSYGGAVTAHPGRPPSAKHMLEITHRIRERDIGCLLTEPGNRPPLVEHLAQDEGMTLAEADPLGLELTPGPGLYEEMMQRLADTFARCLSHGE
jgi:zinc transport system substrate-binding protein